MLNFAVCEINKKQYLIYPGKKFSVDFLGEGVKSLEASVLLLSEDGNIKIGKPYLDKKITLECLGDKRGEKIRVAKFHAKANYRKVTGSRAKLTEVVLKAESKKDKK
ncbi:50S ribosomal protein L21 [Candidatus Daviesbacteria bacterium]|nr:50S ribosomal protein L21 [Candidatus Daviesbacteria bacterium]